MNHSNKQILTSRYTPYLNQEGGSSNHIESLFVRKARTRKRKKYRVYTYSQQAVSIPTQKRRARCSSLVEMNKNKLKVCVTHASHADILMKKSYHQNHPKYTTDLAHESSVSSLDFFKNPLIQTKWIVYRCQLSTKEESCCCSCNSDAMFEVMKSLYDCYKKKNCDHCNCILCGHMPREERDLAKIRTSLADIGASMPSDAEKKEKTKKALSSMTGKSGPEKEKILRDLAMSNIPLPEPKTPSEKDLIEKVRRDLGLPPEPTNPADKAKLRKNEQLGIGVIPLEGKTPEQKEKILRAQFEKGLPLPEGRTPSEKALINKIKAEKFHKAKTPEEKEKMLRDLANQGMAFPEGKTPSEKKLIDKVRDSLGLPPEPKTPSLREKYNKAGQEGLLVPLEGKTPAQKEKILQDLANRGIPLPEGRTPSEKALIAKIKAKPSSKKTPSEKIRRAKAAGLITPLQGKTPEEKEKILRGLADMGIPFPEGKTPSEKKLIAKVRADLGLPPEPKSPSLREKYNKAADDGLIVPLEGKTPAEKEKILQDLADRGIPLPEGRTPSEKALIAKIKTKPKKAVSPSEKIRNAKAAGLLTPLKGKTPEERERILRGLANLGLPLPEAKSPSERKIINKVIADLGLPPEARSPSLREKYNKASDDGVLQPLEGRTPAEKEKNLRNLHARGIPLPEGRTPSEKSLIARIKAGPKIASPSERAKKLASPSEKIRNAKAAGLLTPLKGKTPDERERILRGLANLGLPLPEAKSPSERKLINKVIADLGLPPEARTPSLREKYNKASDDGVLQPLEGRTPAEKEKNLRNLHARGIPLPEGRTPSEKSLIARIKAGPKMASPSERAKKVASPSEKMRNAKAAGLLTPLKGKTPQDKEKILRGLAMLGLPLPEGKTKSEKDLLAKVRADLGLPPEPATPSMREKYNNAANNGNMLPLEGKTPAEKEKILTDLFDRDIPLPEGRTPSEKSLIARVKARKKPSSIKTRPSERLRRAKAAGLLTPLKGKTPEQKENILKGLAKHGLPLPEGQTPSEKKLIDKVRNDLGLPPEPSTPALRDKYKQAADAGLMVPLEGKTPAEKEKILQGLANMGIPLPVGRTPSEKALIADVKRKARPPSEGRGTRRRSVGPPALPDPERKKLDAKTAKVMKEGKGPSQECICGLLTPESDRERMSKALAPGSVLADKMREAKAAGLLTPLEGKSPEQKEKILKGLAKRGLPLPEGKTPSEKKLIDKVRADMGLPPSARTPSMKAKYAKAQAAGLITPLEGKSPAQKQKILKSLADSGVPLPEGRTPSEKALIASIKKSLPTAKGEPLGITTEKIRKAKAAGLLTPLEGKSPEQKEKILRGLAKAGFPLPEGKSPSDKALIRKIKSEFKIPEDAASEKMRKARAAGLVTPLTGKTPAQKEKILRGLAAAGLPLPEGKTPSEKELIKKVKADTGYSTPTPSERMKRAQAAGLLTPLAGKTPEQKRKALRARMAAGIPLPEGTTPSEKEMIRQLLAEDKSPSAKLKASKKLTPSQKLKEAKAAGLLTPIEGKTPAQKEKILRGLAKAGLPLPEGTTPSEKSMINRIRTEEGIPPPAVTPSEKAIVQKAKAEGLLTPIAGKTPKEKERILKGLADAGLPLPIGTTPSEKALIKKVRAEAGLPLEPTPSEKRGKIKRKAKKVGVGSMKSAKAKTGAIGAEFEDIVKTTKCDRGCGCDKKKIRFKHSYVKIRVTSPDFSSICACPDECFPGIKGGIITDNEGIKVTVGSAVGVPKYFNELTNNKSPEMKTNSLNKSKPDTHDRYIAAETTEPFIDNTKQSDNYSSSIIKIYNSKVYSKKETIGLNICGSNHNSNDSLGYSPYNTESDKPFSDSHDVSSPAICEDWTEEYEGLETSIGSSTGISIPISITLISRDYSSSDTYSSLNSMRTESSLNLSASTSISDNVYKSSMMSSENVSSDSVPLVFYPKPIDAYNTTPYQEFTYTSDSNELINEIISLRDKRRLFNVHKKQNEFLIFRVTQSRFSCKNTNNLNRKDEPIVIMNNLSNNRDIDRMIDEFLANKEFSNTSVFLVVPDSDENSLESSSGLNSTICIQDTDTASHCKENSVSAISVRKTSSIGTSPKEEYHDKLLYHKHTKEYYPGTFTATTNETNINKHASPISSYEKHVKKQQKITIYEDNRPKVTKTTSTTPSVHEKKTKKNYFKQFLRNKHAKNKLADVTLTSASSLDRRPKKKYVRCKKRSASHAREPKQSKNERLDLATDNDKSYKTHEPLQVQTLFKSVKSRSHKRCQVVAPKMKIKNKKINIGDKQDGDDILQMAAVNSKVPSPTVQCGASPVHDPKAQTNLSKNETNVFRSSARHDVCPLHGISKDWRFDTDYDSISNDGRLERSSEHFPCPIHGHNGINENGIIESNYNSSTPNSNYYSSEISVCVMQGQRSCGSRRNATSHKLLCSLRSAFKKPDCHRCNSKTKTVAAPCERHERANKKVKQSTAGCQCGNIRIVTNPSCMKTRTRTEYKCENARSKSSRSKYGFCQRSAKDKQCKQNKKIYCRDMKREHHSPIPCFESKNKSAKAKLQCKKCCLPRVNGECLTPHTMRRGNGDKQGKGNRRCHVCECEESESSSSQDSRESTCSKADPYCVCEGASDETECREAGAVVCECDEYLPHPDTTQCPRYKKRRKADPYCVCDGASDESEYRKAGSVICECDEYLPQPTQGYRDKKNRKAKNVECQCWPSDAEQENNANSIRPTKSQETKDDIKHTKTGSSKAADGDATKKESNIDPKFDDSDEIELAKDAPSTMLMPGEFHDLQIVYIRDIMKMLSECSQTTSGFTMNVLKRSPSDAEPTYEEALKFYKTHAKKRKEQYRPPSVQNVVCGCPLDEPDIDVFKGFKVAVGAKGPASKGLSGIFCFNVQTDVPDSIT